MVSLGDEPDCCQGRAHVLEELLARPGGIGMTGPPPICPKAFQCCWQVRCLHTERQCLPCLDFTAKDMNMSFEDIPTIGKCHKDKHIANNVQGTVTNVHLYMTANCLFLLCITISTPQY